MKKSLVSKLSYFCVTASLASFLVLSGCGSTDSTTSTPQSTAVISTYSLNPTKSGTADADYVAATINATVINTKPGAGDKIQILFSNQSSTSTDNYKVQVKINALDLVGYSGTINYTVYAKSTDTSGTTGNVTLVSSTGTDVIISTGLVSSNSKIEIQLPASNMKFKLFFTPQAPTVNATSSLPAGASATKTKLTDYEGNPVRVDIN